MDSAAIKPRPGQLAQAAGLANVDGRWCEVDVLSYASKVLPNIHVLGDAIDAGLPKSAHMANTQAKICAQAVYALMQGQAPEPAPAFANTCYSFVDDRQAMHISTLYRSTRRKEACRRRETAFCRRIVRSKRGRTLMRGRGRSGLMAEDPYCGHVFVFRGRRGDMLKVLWWSGDGLCLLAKRLERGRFVWPQATSGSVSLTQAQLSMLLEGIDWRRPERTWRPTSAL